MVFWNFGNDRFNLSRRNIATQSLSLTHILLCILVGCVMCGGIGVGTSHALEVRAWLSDVGAVDSGVVVKNQNDVYAEPGATNQELHVWMSQGVLTENLTAVGLNLVSTNPSVIDFQSVTVYDVEHTAGGCNMVNGPDGCRWEFTVAPTPAVDPDEVIGMAGINIENGTGIGASSIANNDSLYDATAQAWLFATVEYNVIGLGSTDLFLQIGVDGVLPDGGLLQDVDVVFGGGNDAALNAESNRGENSATADGSVRVGLAVWDGNSAVGTPGDDVNWGDPNNWTVLGQTDVLPLDEDPGDAVEFPAGTGTIDLGEDRIVNELDFQGDYQLDNDTLTVTAGVITVDTSSTATITSDIASDEILLKIGEGSLIVDGDAPAISILQGTVGGVGTIAGISNEQNGILSPGAPNGGLPPLIGRTDPVTLPEPSGLALLVMGWLGWRRYRSLGNTSRLGTSDHGLT